MSDTTAEPTAISVTADPDPALAESDAMPAEGDVTAVGGDVAAVGGDSLSAEPDPPAAASSAQPPATGDRSLLALVDRLAAILERSDLVELEVEAGGTGLVLRKPEALSIPVAGAGTALTGSIPGGSSTNPAMAGTPSGSVRPSVAAPLTGIWYAAPSPGTPPFVQVGGEVAAGQVIGLIEAMKLFNEIKSDRSGRVAAVLVESGQLVKARQPLIEVLPL